MFGRSLHLAPFKNRATGPWHFKKNRSGLLGNSWQEIRLQGGLRGAFNKANL